ncbi:B3 domain-containing protein [Heracleum sosnowskyi]|uniref:B3 domain-containing protein n=1 Tax=Heracleum sosnowskyi TaxID=360622 RepID=A0AAD8H1R3_9APIA|nr:B3 domain-containing protein [Heracleum sosnowskyi]
MDSKNSATSSFVLMKQMPKPETKKMVAPKKNRNFKSKAKKQVNPADPGKASYGRRKTNIDSLYQDSDTKKSVMRRADEVLQSIPMEYPRFSKPMISSNVSSGFWLILPLEFCKRYMPNKDLAVVLVDDLGIQWGTSYLKKQHGFSAGWRGFAMNHGLLKGDILVFHKISPKVFKVNIVRVNDLDATDGALILMHMSTSIVTCLCIYNPLLEMAVIIIIPRLICNDGFQSRPATAGLGYSNDLTQKLKKFKSSTIIMYEFHMPKWFAGIHLHVFAALAIFVLRYVPHI